MFSHYPAMHITGLHIVIVGPGAANNFHAKVINPGLPRNGSAVGRDFMTTEQLPFSSGRPWDFGVDTMVLKVAGPRDFNGKDSGSRPSPCKDAAEQAMAHWC